MLPNLNNKNKRLVMMILHEKYLETKTRLEGKMFDRLIVKEYTKQCGDNYYHGKVPVGINVEVRVKAKVSAQERLNGYITNLPNVNSLCQSVCKSLVGVAYDSEYQVAELFATKIYGNEDRIVIEVEML